jgi:hypothetical protein
VIAALLACLSVAAPLPEPPPVPPELLKARLQEAEKAYQGALQSYLRGEHRSNLEEVARWSRCVLEAKRPLCKGKEDQVVAAQEYLKRMKDLEAEVNKLVRAGKERPFQSSAARYYCAEAEILLAQLKGR